MSKELLLLVIHCTDTPAGRIVSGDDIRQWHIKERGWSRVGYRDLILLNGLVENLHEFDHDNEVDPWEITNGAAGYNSIAAHICYVGGKGHDGRPTDTRTTDQIETLKHYCHMMIRRHPNIRIAGHNELSSKACPSFNVRHFLESIGIPKRNIYKINQP